MRSHNNYWQHIYLQFCWRMREGRKTVTNDQVGLFHLHEWKFLRRTQRMCGSKWKVVLCTPYEKCYSSSKNLKKLPYDPATSLIGIYPKELKAGSWRAICTLIFIAAWFTLVKKWKWSQVSIDRWVNKQVWYTHTMEYYSAIKKNSDTSYLMNKPQRTFC